MYTKALPYLLRKEMEQGKYKSAVPVTKTDRYKPDQWYWCGYWHQAYKVLEANYQAIQGRLHLKNVTVQWDDGKVGTHCTSLDSDHDYKLYL